MNHIYFIHAVSLQNYPERKHYGQKAIRIQHKDHTVQEKDFPYNGQKITCTSELIDFAKSLQDADIE